MVPAYPLKTNKEFLLVDLLNNLKNLPDDTDLVLRNLNPAWGSSTRNACRNMYVSMDVLRPEQSYKGAMSKLVHELAEAKALFETLGAERNLLPVIVEKDYWVMHCLWACSKIALLLR